MFARIGNLRFLTKSTHFTTKKFYSSELGHNKHSCKLLVVGGGTGGCAVAAKFSKVLKKHELIIVDPSEYHYYQPLFTLVGGGIEKLEEARRKQENVLPSNATWIKDSAVEYDVKKQTVRTQKGHTIEYDYLLVAVGLELRFDKIPGLLDALEKKNTGVCSNYSPKYVVNTFPTMQSITSGNAIFTFPNSPVKCPGAPQKICYITDHYLRKEGKRNNVNVMYNTSLPVIFGVKKYADALWKVCKERNITVNLRTNLIEVKMDKKIAVFENLDTKLKTEIPYSMLHVTPPMATPETLSKNKDLTNEAGFVNVHKATMQHLKYPNVYAIGDCCSCPNSKTAAAAAAQTEVVYENLMSTIEGKTPKLAYDGYASCPLVTGYDRCILAEFDYDLNPLETFPFDQDKEMYSMFLLKKNVMPPIYWHLMMNGHWNGPALLRKLLHFDFSEKK